MTKLDLIAGVICLIILLASLAGLIGGILGKKFADRVSEKQFRIAFKLLLTLIGLQLIISGIGQIESL